MESYSLLYFHFFLLACFQGSVMFYHASALHSLVWLNNIPLFGSTTFCYPFIIGGYWVVATVWLLCIMLLCAHTFLYVHTWAFISLGYTYADEIAGYCLSFKWQSSQWVWKFLLYLLLLIFTYRTEWNSFKWGFNIDLPNG